MARFIRLLMLLVAPLWLTSCLLVPTKFASTLDISADRSFTFTYVGEVQLLKTSKPGTPSGEWPGDEGAPPADDGSAQPGDEDGGGEPTLRPIAIESSQSMRPVTVGTLGDTAEEEAQLKRLAETLSKEYGFRSARYIGNHTLAIDYRISGRLDHSFVFPFNPDGEVLVPFLAVELRGKDRLRIKAPGFANDSDTASSIGGMASGPSPGARLDGKFTLMTNAEIVSQNQENDSETAPDGKKRIVWAVTPETRDAPMAVLKVQPLP